MPNHVHFLIEIGFMSLSKIMQGLQQSYTSYFHKRHAGISNKSIADFLKRDASSITRMIHKIDDIINNDRILSSNVDKIMQVLQV